jgi:hypothetical protein
MLFYQNSIKMPTPDNFQTYKNYRNLYNSLIRTSKKLFFEQQLTLYQSDSKKTWELINLATKRPVPIFKSGDPTEINNYRPISLLSSFGKNIRKNCCNQTDVFLGNQF